jgi:hypothetical protein
MQSYRIEAGAWVMSGEHRHRDMCHAEIVIRCCRGGKAEASLKAPTETQRGLAELRFNDRR